MASMNVQVLSKKVIKPSNPTPNDLGNLNLSLFDQLSPHMHFHIIFYYFGDCRNESAERISELEKSLSRTLNTFYPLAGRYSQKHVCIDCHDQGIEWFEARVSGKLSEFLKKPKIEQLVDEFLPWKSFPPAANLVTTPLLGIQINTFDCGGMTLGMSISHAIADGNTIFRRFITEWARNNRTVVHPPHQVADVNTTDHSYNQFASLFPSRASHDDSLSDTYLTPEEDCEFVSKRLFYSDTMISNIREEFAPLFDYKPSRVVVVMALLWKALMVASRAKHGGQIRNSTLAIAMDLSGKQSSFQPPPRELNYGNFWMLVPVSFLGRDEAKIELQNLVGLVGNTIRDAKQKLVKASSSDEISSMFLNYRKEIVRKVKECKEWDTYFISSWCNFPLQEVDFGWGMPFWVTTATTQRFAVNWLMDAISGDGIEAWVNLTDKDMLELEKFV